MSDLFLSYSRRDDGFAKRLHEAFTAAGKDVWADWEEIAPTADWMATIYEAIEDADAFVFVLSPDSVESEICGRELAHAAGLNKRIIPLLRRDVDPKGVPEPAARHQWIGFRSDAEFDASFKELEEALATDLEWAAAHTHWLRRARDWDNGGREASKLLRGSDLRSAELWLSEQRPDRIPEPTALQSEYVGASRRAATRRQRMSFAAVATALVVAIVLAVVALIQRSAAIDQKQQAQARALAASADQVANSNRELSARLAAAAVRTRDTPASEAALRRAVGQLNYDTLLAGHTDRVLAIAYSPDDDALVTGSDDGTARIWDPHTGEQTAEIEPHGGAVTDVAYGADGQRVAVADGDSPVGLYDAGDGHRVAQLSDQSTADQVAFTPDGSALLTTGAHEPLRVWDADDLTQVASAPPITEGADDLELDRAGDRAVTVADDVRVWRTSDASEVGVPISGTFFRAALSPDGATVAATDGNGQLSLWDVATGDRTMALHTAELQSLEFSPDGRVLAGAGYDHALHFYDVSNGDEFAVLHGHENDLTDVAFSSDGSHVATASGDRTARVWTTPVAGPATLTGHRGGVNAVAYTPDGSQLATGANDGTVRTWNLTTGKSILTMGAGRYTSVTDVAYSPDGTRLAATAFHSIHVWDAQSGKPSVTKYVPGGDLEAVSFSPDGSHIAVGSDDGAARILDAQSGDVVQTLKGHTNEVLAVAFSPDGSRLATASSDETARIWDADSGEQLAELRGHDESVFDIAFSPDGQRVVTASYDHSARIWDAASGDELEAMRGSDGPVNAAAFAPNGATVATASNDGTARIWATSDGEELERFEGNKRAVQDVAFAPDGRSIATAGLDRTARIFTCASACESVDELLSEADLRAGELSDSERDQYTS